MICDLRYFQDSYFVERPFTSQNQAVNIESIEKKLPMTDF